MLQLRRSFIFNILSSIYCNREYHLLQCVLVESVIISNVLQLRWSSSLMCWKGSSSLMCCSREDHSSPMCCNQEDHHLSYVLQSRRSCLFNMLSSISFSWEINSSLISCIWECHHLQYVVAERIIISNILQPRGLSSLKYDEIERRVAHGRFCLDFSRLVSIWTKPRYNKLSKKWHDKVA